MSAPPSSASLAQPLRDAYKAILVALRLPAAASAAEASPSRGGLHGWCMRAIQTVTQAAPASRRGVVAGSSGSLSSAAAAASDTQGDAALVLAFLSNMLHLFHMRPQLLDEDEAEQQLQLQQQQQQHSADGSGGMDDDGASQMSSTSVFGGRSLLPFLYAHLFRYALQLQQFETYYQLLLHMPAQFHHESAVHQGGGGGGGEDKLKLECLKRFLIELLRERRTHHLIQQFDWNFPWQPRAQSTLQQESSNDLPALSSAAVGEKTVREEVEAILWFNAQTSDISEETEGAAAFLPSQVHNSAAFAQPSLAAGSSAAAGANAIHASHYDLLYSFLLSNHSYLRAAQCMHHFLLRLEKETSAGGGKSGETFAKNTVARLKKARGRALSAGGAQSKRGAIAAPSHSEQTQTELAMLTLDAIGRLLRRKLHALVLVRDALQLAARSSPQRDADPRECFMLENDSSSQEQQIEAAQKEASELSAHSRSPLYKRSRNDLGDQSAAVDDAAADASPFPIVSHLDLLSLRAVENRLELVLSQLDMLSVLQSRVLLSHAALPPLDPLLDTPVQPAQIAAHLEKLVRWGLFDRAFHMVQVFYNVTGIGGSAADKQSLECNPLNEPFEIASTFLFRELTARICRMHASLLDGEWTEEDLASPLRVEDSMAELAMQGRVARGTATEATSGSEQLESLRLRDAESVLQLYLHRFDALSTGLVFSLAVAEEYLTSGAEVPLWLRDRFAAFMDDPRAFDHEDDEHEQKIVSASSGLFRMQRASATPSGHEATLSSFPFLTFLRSLLRHGRFELLYVLTCRYLDWLAVSSISVIGGSSARTLDRSVVSDIFEAFLWVADQALEQLPPANAESKAVQKQTQAWVDGLRHKLARIIGGSSTAPAGSRNGGKAAEQRVTVGFGNQQTTTKFGFGGPAPVVVPAFGAAQPAASTILPVGSVPAPSFTPAAAPAASPFSGAGFGFGAPSAAAAPSFSPFASDQSAAATPAKHAFGGLAPMQPAPSAAPVSSFSFGGGTGAPSSAGLFGAPAPSSNAAAAAAPAPFSFGGFSTANANPPNPFTSTASIIARAAAAQ